MAGFRDRVVKGWVLKELCAQETRVPNTFQGIEDTSPEQLFWITNKRNAM